MRDNRRTFWLIWVVAIIPVLTAVAMYFSGLLTPQNTVNRGELLASQTIDQWQLSHLGQPWVRPKQWNIFQTSNVDCETEPCQRWQQALPKVIARLGKDSDRVMFLQVGSREGVLHSPKLEVLGDAIWLVDPLGNLVLRYPLNMQPEDLLKDLKKLLKLSGIG